MFHLCAKHHCFAKQRKFRLRAKVAHEMTSICRQCFLPYVPVRPPSCASCILVGQTIVIVFPLVITFLIFICGSTVLGHTVKTTGERLTSFRAQLSRANETFEVSRNNDVSRTGTYGKKHCRQIDVISCATFACKRNFRCFAKQ